MIRAIALGFTVLALGGCIPGDDRAYRPAPPLPARQRAEAQRPAPQYDAPAAQEPGPPLDDYQRRRPDDEVSILPAPRPAWEARPVTPDADDVADGSYLVWPGDPLRRVPERTGARAEAIARANRLDAPFTVRAGARLRIPGGRYHLVRQGQSGIAIARAYGVEWSRIVAANDLAEPYILRVGQRVVIPGSAGEAPSRADRAAAFKLDIDDIITGGEPAPAPRQQPVRPATSAARVLPPSAVVVAPTRLTGGAFLWPVDGRVVKRFGPGASGERNDGIKIAVRAGTPIHAVADGVVAYVGDGIAALGGLVIVKHGGGWTSVYGHASKLLVQRGQSVKRGQTIALSGDTGFADQPEVHFELRKGRVPVDPQTQLTRG